ncbi:MAG: SulP family inorganic anion transporter [Alphaproteobacteria bacterium]
MKKPSALYLYMPKILTCFHDGYPLKDFKSDIFAGLSMAMLSLPIAMAYAIVSGATPLHGLYTSIIAGFLVALLGGTRFQISGQTGAFAVIIYTVIESYGFDALALVTLMTGLILMMTGFMRMGGMIKYMPYPMMTGFTAGIAVLIFINQVKDLVGLDVERMPKHFIDKCSFLYSHLPHFDPATALLGFGTLGFIFLLSLSKRKWPAYIIAMLGSMLAAWWFGLDVETLGSRYGGIPNSFPTLSFPDVTLEKISLLLPYSLTLALLASIESLLAAVVSDGMTGANHRSNGELVAEGAANTATALLGFLPSSGSFSRTISNVKLGARTPIAAMTCALTLLIIVQFFHGFVNFFPLTAVAAVLMYISWNMLDIKKIKRLLTTSSGSGDGMVLMITFFLTILIDVKTALWVGFFFASLVFIRNISRTTEVQLGGNFVDNDDSERILDDPRLIFTENKPEGVEIFHIKGPFFFGTVWRLNEVLRKVQERPKVYILDFKDVPFIDASGVNTLDTMVKQCRINRERVIFVKVNESCMQILQKMRLLRKRRTIAIAKDLDEAIKMAKVFIAEDEEKK